MRKWTKPSWIVSQIVIRPCALLLAVFVLMFVLFVFMVSQYSPQAAIQIAGLGDFIDQQSDATLIVRALESAYWFFNVDQDENLKKVPL